jgi:hypothetical protein
MIEPANRLENRWHYPHAIRHRAGSALHVMRSRRRSSRQVVVAHAPREGTHVMGERLGARPRLTSQPCNPLAPRVVATRERSGGADELAERSGLRRGHAPVGHPIRLGVHHGVLTGGARTRRPQALGTLAAARTPVQGHDGACLGVQGPPSPWVVRLLRHTAGHGVRCHRQAWDHDVLSAGERRDGTLGRHGCHAWPQTAPSPRAGDPHRATAAAPRDPRPPHACAPRAGVLRAAVLGEAIDTLASTIVALIMRLAMMEVPVVLVLG